MNVFILLVGVRDMTGKTCKSLENFFNVGFFRIRVKR